MNRSILINNKFILINSANITIHNNSIQIYDIYLIIKKQLNGLKWYMYNQWLITALLFIFIFVIIQVLLLKLIKNNFNNFDKQKLIKCDNIEDDIIKHSELVS